MVYVATGALALRRRRRRGCSRVGALVSTARSRRRSTTASTAWLDPWTDERDNGYQIVQSLYTIADGGVFGTGLGRGFVLTDGGNTVIPFAQTDFIYSVDRHRDRPRRGRRR